MEVMAASTPPPAESAEGAGGATRESKAPLGAASTTPPSSSCGTSPPGSGSKTHHLLKHQLPEGDVSHHFGTSDLKAITKIVNRMGQRELQAKFREVFETPTFSNNNNWLRRKLMEAAGIQSPRVQQKAKKGPRRSGGSPKKKLTSAKKALFRAEVGAGPAPGEATPAASRISKRESKPQAGAAEPSANVNSERRRSARQRAKAIDVHLVWAKLQEHGWWPAQVVDSSTVYTMEQPSIPGDYVLVQFIEDGSHAWALQSEALDMLDNWKYLANSNSSPAFQAAVRVAHQMLCAQNSQQQLQQQQSYQQSHQPQPHQPPTQNVQQYQLAMSPPATRHFGEVHEVDSSMMSLDSIRYGGHPSAPYPYAARNCSPSDFSHESTDDVLAPNHLNHFCESLLIPGVGQGHCSCSPFLLPCISVFVMACLERAQERNRLANGMRSDFASSVLCGTLSQSGVVIC